MSRKLSIVSGGFDPAHVGHLELFEKAKSIADDLFVILNCDKFLERKKGKPFMPFKERTRMIEALKPVDMVVGSIDTDDTVCKTLEWIHGIYNRKYSEIMFCNGGDRTYVGNTPEHAACVSLGIETVYGMGDKIQSSSSLIKKSAKKTTVKRHSNAGSLFF